MAPLGGVSGVIARMRAQLAAQVAHAARRAALGGAGLVCVLVGAGFLLSALWIVLAQAWGALVASAVMGAVLFGAGLILIGLAGRGGDKAAQAAPGAVGEEPTPGAEGQDDPSLRRLLHELGLSVPPRGTPPALTEGFLFGLILAMRLQDGRDTGAGPKPSAEERFGKPGRGADRTTTPPPSGDG